MASDSSQDVDYPKTPPHTPDSIPTESPELVRSPIILEQPTINTPNNRRITINQAKIHASLFGDQYAYDRNCVFRSEYDDMVSLNIKCQRCGMDVQKSLFWIHNIKEHGILCEYTPDDEEYNNDNDKRKEKD